MAGLIKADLYRTVKDKMFMILLIIAAGLSVVTIGLYAVLINTLSGLSEGVDARDTLTASTLALTGLSPYQNYGLIVAIFLCIIFGKDFMQGTARNKLIMGKTRTEVYFSNVIVSAFVMISVILVYAALNFALGCIVFNSGLKTGFLPMLKGIGLSLIGWIVLSITISFLSVAMPNVGLSIVIYVISGLALSFGGQILNAVLAINGNGAVEFINNINIPYVMTYVLTGQFTYALMGQESFAAMGTVFYLEYIFSCVFFAGVFLFFGWLIFQRKDLK